MTRPERIVFAGSPEFAVVQLDALHAAGAPLAGVLSQPDRPAGRKRRLQPTPVKARALDLGLPVQTPSSLRRGDGPGDLAALEPDLLVVAAYGLILPRAVLELPRHGCLNVHASLLPRWRGAAPVERAIMAGDAQTGVCIMAMDEGLDTGAVLHRRAVAIGEADTGGELEATLAGLGAAALLEVLDDLDAFPPEPQPEAGVTYAAKLTREDALVDFDSDARSLAGRIRALNPRLPVAVTTPDGTRLRLLRARAEAGAEDAAPGTVLALEDGALRIAAADGSVAVHELQVVGGKGTVLSGADLVNALRTRVPPGAQLRG